MEAESDFPEEVKSYNQRLHGYYGEFGTGANAKIFFLQSALRPVDLDRVTLIGEIAGSETWSIRDLFQREVDVDRITRGLLPYLRNESKIKFFNPLTLTILPMREDTNAIDSVMPVLQERIYKEGSTEWKCWEKEGVFRYRHPKDRPYYGIVEWNDTRSKIVAIDGQHRLSALKRFLKDTETSEKKEQFLQWTIPVVVFSIRALNLSTSNARILDVVRSVFIYINTQAQPPTIARQILLTDESVNAICSQELVEYAHENDAQPEGKREPNRVPLMFYDWRGLEVEGKPKIEPASLKSIKEIRDWFQEYIFGIDFSAKQEAALQIQPLDSLHEAFTKGKLDVRDAGEVRKLFRQKVLPGIEYFLEYFTPYNRYIEQLRSIEAEYCQKSDVGRHAFHLRRFGSHRGGGDIEDRVRDVYREIVKDLNDAKADIPEILRLDIGMRGIVCALAECRAYYEKSLGKTTTWLDYAKWFTEQVNYVYGDGWLTAKAGIKRDLLLHVTYDHNNNTQNYRLEQAQDALGGWIVLLVGRFGLVKTKIPSDEVWQTMWEACSEKLMNTILKGYRKEVRVILKEQYPSGGKPLNDAVKKQALQKADEHMDKFEKALKKIN